MPDQGSWISLARAVAAVQAATGGAPGAVYQTLISICADGIVRARWTAHHSKTQPAIHRRDWIGADIDWANFRVVKAEGSGMAGVDFSEDDLNGWATKQKLIPAEPSSPVGKEAAARRAVAACYPQGVPPDVQNGPLCSILAGWIKSSLPNMSKISDSTLLRAASRKKEAKAKRAK